MSPAPAAGALPDVRRQLRVIAILAAAEAAAIAPLPARQLHAVGYFADALAPVWDLQILDPQLLKRSEGPTSPALQADVDRLVGCGVLRASALRHSEDSEGLWHLEADYALNQDFAAPILAATRRFERFAHELDYLREVVFAMAGLGTIGIAQASASDAAYGDQLIDYGGLLDIAPIDAEPNRSVQVARRFGELMAPEVALGDAEQVHLYVCELHNRLAAARD